MVVTLSETDRLDFVLKKFRRQVTKAGLFQDMKRTRFYESPSARRRRKDCQRRVGGVTGADTTGASGSGVKSSPGFTKRSCSNRYCLSYSWR